MLKLIAAIVMSVSLFSIAPSGPKSTSVSPVEIFSIDSAEAATCSPKYTACTVATDCCSYNCKATSRTSKLCL